jgi:hypothetical protein
MAALYAAGFFVRHLLALLAEPTSRAEQFLTVVAGVVLAIILLAGHAPPKNTPAPQDGPSTEEPLPGAHPTPTHQQQP